MFKRLMPITISLLLTASAWAQKNKMNLYIWSEYIDPKIIQNFEKEFDCKVTVDLYEDNESMMAKLEGGGDSLYDVCVPSDYIIPALIKNGLLAPLRKENIPNMKNMDPKFASREYDPGNKFTAPYQWGTVGLYVHRKPSETIDETWGLIFDPKKQMKEARDILIEAKKRSMGFEGGVGIKNKVLAKVCKVGMVYNGDAVRGMKEDPSTYFFVPREGTEIWLDNMAIPAKAPHRDMAEKFLNYILDAKVGAQLSNFNQYATPNLAAREFITPADLKNIAIYPSEEQLKVLEPVKDLGSKTGWYDELWTGIKSK